LVISSSGSASSTIISFSGYSLALLDLHFVGIHHPTLSNSNLGEPSNDNVTIDSIPSRFCPSRSVTSFKILFPTFNSANAAG